MKPLQILIATGIYPPDIGGPAQYAWNIEKEFRRMGNSVSVVSFRLEKRLPIGLRHLLYFLRVVVPLIRSDFVIALDTFSVALPATLAAKIFKKKIIIRTGGDFLWESYTERTGDLVLFSRFYETRKSSFSLKEKIIFYLTKWILRSVDMVVFSTAWQRDIFVTAYELDKRKNYIIENYYGPKLSLAVSKNNLSDKKVFAAAARSIKIKNGEVLSRAFKEAVRFDKDIVLDTSVVPYNKFMEKLANSYAVILPSIGEISPNMILDAISVNKPFILTRECGLYERLKNIALFCDPLDKDDIRDKIIAMADKNTYERLKKEIEAFSFIHTWGDISREFLTVYKKIISD